MQTTSGFERSRNSSTRGRRERTELTFQVAMRMAVPLFRDGVDAQLGRLVRAMRHGDDQAILLGHEETGARARCRRDLLLRLPHAGRDALEHVDGTFTARCEDQ